MINEIETLHICKLPNLDAEFKRDHEVNNLACSTEENKNLFIDGCHGKDESQLSIILCLTDEYTFFIFFCSFNHSHYGTASDLNTLSSL